MRFKVIIERSGDWFTGYCPDLQGANGQGRTKEECIENLKQAIARVLEDRREDPPDADGSPVPT
jgi:predicted RNase H-like HicB family nuclease